MPQDSEPQLTAEIDETWQGEGAAVLRVVGEVDLASMNVLTGAFEDLVDRHLTDVIIDATGVTFMDSTGLHALVEGKRRIHEAGTTIVLIASPQVRRSLELVFPDPLFAARVETMEEALTALANRR